MNPGLRVQENNGLQFKEAGVLAVTRLLALVISSLFVPCFVFSGSMMSFIFGHLIHLLVGADMEPLLDNVGQEHY
jgi:hypothetical protein